MSLFAFDPWSVLQHATVRAAPPKPAKTPNADETPKPKLGELASLGEGQSQTAFFKNVCDKPYYRTDILNSGNRKLPVSWTDIKLMPSSISICSCCGSSHWWGDAKGWRCHQCHPPLPGKNICEIKF